jgi:tetratricopeptide (TPR) repeat protein
MLTTALLLLALQADASAPPKDAPPEKCAAGLSGLACEAVAPATTGGPCGIDVAGRLVYPAYATPIPHTRVEIQVIPPPPALPYTIDRYSDAWNQFRISLPGPSPVFEYWLTINAEGMELLRQKVFMPRECKPDPGIALDVLLHPAVKPSDEPSEDTIAVESLGHKVPDKMIQAFDQSMEKKAKAQPQEMEAAFQQVVNAAPDYYDASLELGLEYKQANQPAEAVRTLTRALELNSGSMPARAALGEYAFDAGNFQTAADLLSQAARLGSISPDVYYMLGTSYYKLGQLAPAEACLRRALSIAPSIGKAYLQLYNVYMKAKMPEKALHSAQTYVQKYPDAGDRAYVQSMVDKLQKSVKPPPH